MTSTRKNGQTRSPKRGAPKKRSKGSDSKRRSNILEDRSSAKRANPFATFSEWESEADEKAYASLSSQREAF